MCGSGDVGQRGVGEQVYMTGEEAYRLPDGSGSVGVGGKSVGYHR